MRGKFIFAKKNMDKQNVWREKYQKIKPAWTDSLSLYQKQVRANFSHQKKILDIGCGHADYFKDIYKNNSNIIGLDPDKNALNKNKIIKNKIVATIEKIPLPDNSTDLIICAFVLEHIENPGAAISEVSRVLAPGGKFIFLTPNKNNYVVFLNRTIPHLFHGFFTKKLYGREENDTYLVRYKLNTERKIDELTGKNDLKREQLIFNEDPSYISFNYLLFYASVLIEKIINKFFAKNKVHLIGVYIKK